jgi:hypothetical protein
MDLDLVVDPFQAAGVDRVSAVVDDPFLVPAQVAREGRQRRNPAHVSQRAPLVECLSGRYRMLVVPDALELILEHIDGVQVLVGLKELSQRLAL